MDTLKEKQKLEYLWKQKVSMENMVNEKSISLMLPIFNCIHTIDATIESILSPKF